MYIFFFFFFFFFFKFLTGTSEHVRRSIFSKAVAGAMKREVDTKHSKSHGKLSDTVSGMYEIKY